MDNPFQPRPYQPTPVPTGLPRFSFSEDGDDPIQSTKKQIARALQKEFGFDAASPDLHAKVDMLFEAWLCWNHDRLNDSALRPA